MPSNQDSKNDDHTSPSIHSLFKKLAALEKTMDRSLQIESPVAGAPGTDGKPTTAFEFARNYLASRQSANLSLNIEELQRLPDYYLIARLLVEEHTETSAEISESDATATADYNLTASSENASCVGAASHVTDDLRPEDSASQIGLQVQREQSAHFQNLSKMFVPCTSANVPVVSPKQQFMPSTSIHVKPESSQDKNQKRALVQSSSQDASSSGLRRRSSRIQAMSLSKVNPSPATNQSSDFYVGSFHLTSSDSMSPELSAGCHVVEKVARRRGPGIKLANAKKASPITEKAFGLHIENTNEPKKNSAAEKVPVVPSPSSSSGEIGSFHLSGDNSRSQLNESMNPPRPRGYFAEFMRNYKQSGGAAVSAGPITEADFGPLPPPAPRPAKQPRLLPPSLSSRLPSNAAQTVAIDDGLRPAVATEDSPMEIRAQEQIPSVSNDMEMVAFVDQFFSTPADAGSNLQPGQLGNVAVNDSGMGHTAQNTHLNEFAVRDDVTVAGLAEQNHGGSQEPLPKDIPGSRTDDNNALLNNGSAANSPKRTSPFLAGNESSSNVVLAHAADSVENAAAHADGQDLAAFAASNSIAVSEREEAESYPNDRLNASRSCAAAANTSSGQAAVRVSGAAFSDPSVGDLDDLSQRINSLADSISESSSETSSSNEDLAVRLQKRLSQNSQAKVNEGSESRGRNSSSLRGCLEERAEEQIEPGISNNLEVVDRRIDRADNGENDAENADADPEGRREEEEVLLAAAADVEMSPSSETSIILHKPRAAVRKASQRLLSVSGLEESANVSVAVATTSNDVSKRKRRKSASRSFSTRTVEVATEADERVDDNSRHGKSNHLAQNEAEASIIQRKSKASAAFIRSRDLFDEDDDRQRTLSTSQAEAAESSFASKWPVEPTSRKTSAKQIASTSSPDVTVHDPDAVVSARSKASEAAGGSAVDDAHISSLPHGQQKQAVKSARKKDQAAGKDRTKSNPMKSLLKDLWSSNCSTSSKLSALGLEELHQQAADVIHDMASGLSEILQKSRARDITQADGRRLMKRMRLIHSQEEFSALVERSLPMELCAELLPCISADKVYPNPKTVGFLLPSFD